MRSKEYPYALTIAVHPTFRHLFGDWVLFEYRSEHNGPFQWKRRIDVVEGFRRVIAFPSNEKIWEVANKINSDFVADIKKSNESDEEVKSLLLKAEKAVKSRSRLQNEERLMLAEAMKIVAELPKPAKEEIKVSSYLLNRDDKEVINELMEEVSQNPLIRIAHLKRNRMVIGLSHQGENSEVWQGYYYNEKTTQFAYREKIASAFGFSGKDHWGKIKSDIRIMLLPRANQLLQLSSVKRMLSEAQLKGQKVLMAGSYVFWYEEEGDVGWVVKASNSNESSKVGHALWNEGTIISKNHGRIVVFPYIKENGERVQGHTKNAPHDGKAKPRHPDEYLELPFEVIDEDLMIGLFGELNYD